MALHGGKINLLADNYGFTFGIYYGNITNP